MEEKQLQGWWDGLPIWRNKTPREKLLNVAKNDEQKKTLNFVADCIDIKIGHE